MGTVAGSGAAGYLLAVGLIVPERPANEDHGKRCPSDLYEKVDPLALSGEDPGRGQYDA